MDPLVLAAGGVAALAVLAGAGGLYTFLQPERTAADRLADLTATGEDPGARPQKLPAIATVAARLAAASDTETAALRKRLLQAGWRARNAADVFNAIRVIATLGLGALGLLITAGKSPLSLAFGGLLGASIGYYVPAILVTNALQKRQQVLMKAFPDALDLLVSSVEAGLGVDAAFRRVADEISEAAPELARELQLVGHEVNAGVPRVEALRHLSDRTGLDDVSQLVNVLVQAERFGTSVARALRSHSDLVRVRRMQRAEEKAARVSPTLTIIMIVFILPCLIVILVGPAIVSVRNALSPSNSAAGSP
jgi:tight adherence protein C